MNLSQPALDVLGEAEARVLHRLSVLAEGASGRRIHALSGVPTLRTTQAILERLVRSGLVNVRRVGAANDYTLNREHILWEPIENVLNAAARLETAIVEELESALGAELDAAMLFGSFARGTASLDSDVDILLIWRSGASADQHEQKLFQVSERLRLISGNDVQMLTLTKMELAELIRERDPLIDSVRADSRPLLGLSTLLKVDS